MEGLEEKETLAVLDLSYNNLGTRRLVDLVPKTLFVARLCELLPKLILLQHFDLSCNGFTQEESMKIAKALENNHTLHGFHFNGNWGYMDEQMFLVVTKDSEKSFGKELLIDQIDSVKCK